MNALTLIQATVEPVAQTYGDLDPLVALTLRTIPGFRTPAPGYHENKFWKHSRYPIALFISAYQGGHTLDLRIITSASEHVVLRAFQNHDASINDFRAKLRPFAEFLLGPGTPADVARVAQALELPGSQARRAFKSVHR